MVKKTPSGEKSTSARVKPRRRHRKKYTDPIGMMAFRAAFEGPPEEYDIDAIEAHLTHLIENEWVSRVGLYLVEEEWLSRLRAYAVGLAMGLNELFDPTGAQCQHETMEAYAQTPDPYKTKLDELVYRVAQEFARFARIPPVEENEFLLATTNTLTDWIVGVDWEKNRDREFWDHLEKTKRDAATLCRDFECLRTSLKKVEHADPGIFLRLMPSVISRVQRYLPYIIDGIRLAKPIDERQGRPRGRKQYPGLAELISELEFNAQLAGGGFGMPNKKQKKGRLIKALDWLRAFLAGSNDWSSLAEFLPTPGQHPFSVYEGALLAVYKLHITRTETEVDDRIERNVENIAPADVRRMRAMAQSMRYIVDE
jgi:hypothetical protein